MGKEELPVPAGRTVSGGVSPIRRCRKQAGKKSARSAARQAWPQTGALGGQIYLSGVILEILLPWMPIPAIKPCWWKKKA